jgi:hypothetical protein
VRFATVEHLRDLGSIALVVLVVGGLLGLYWGWSALLGGCFKPGENALGPPICHRSCSGMRIRGPAGIKHRRSGSLAGERLLERGCRDEIQRDRDQHDACEPHVHRQERG